MELPRVELPQKISHSYFSHPSQAIIISHLDFSNHYLNALPDPILVHLTVYLLPYSQYDLCKSQITLEIKISVYVFTRKY